MAIVTALIVVCLVLALVALGLGPSWLIHKAVERGDHRGAFRLLDRLGRLMPGNDVVRALLLVQSGEPKQAQALTTAALENPKEEIMRDLFSQYMLLGSLGQSLIDQEQYREAAIAFERAIRAKPRTNGFDGLAEVRILQGLPAEALALIDRAFQCEQARSWLELKLEGYEHGHLWANRAWAQALLGSRAEAAESLDRAFTAAGKHKPERAGVHYRAGMVSNVIGEPAKSREHFQAAIALDPDGRYGKKARAAEAAITASATN